ncbi:response regulator transcription factor [Microbacterium sp. gxy059]|uniref:helix-turn-helix transcriptional regulator n=1 Tax=Microbacterium sp. gxy059 TaxID=2957199 RepID=UPI003D986766
MRQARALLDLDGHTLRTRAATQTIGAVAALREGDEELAEGWLRAAAVSADVYGPRAHVGLLAPRERTRLLEFARAQDDAELRRYLEAPEGATLGPRVVPSLTPREHAVLEALDRHGTTREIAEALVVSPHTVKAQLQSVYRKLGVSSRRGAVVAARELGLLPEEERER